MRKEINSDSKKLIKYSEALLDGKWSKLEGMPPLFILSTLAISLKPVFDKFIKMGFSESVFYDTMSDVKIWGEDYRTHHNGDIGVTEILISFFESLFISFLTASRTISSL